MTHAFPELAIGGVLVAPFVLYAIVATVLFALLRPLLRSIGLERWFSSPPVAELCVFVVILASLIILF